MVVSNYSSFIWHFRVVGCLETQVKTAKQTTQWLPTICANISNASHALFAFLAKNTNRKRMVLFSFMSEISQGYLNYSFICWLFSRLSVFVSAADQPVNEQDTRFALAVVELQVNTNISNWGEIWVLYKGNLWHCYQNFNWPFMSASQFFSSLANIFVLCSNTTQHGPNNELRGGF